MSNERRRQGRLRLAFPVLLDGPWGIRRCIARDVSATGIFVQTLEPYELGTAIKIIFAVPDGSWEMAIHCIVRHIIRLPLVPGDDPMHGVGLSFEQVEDDIADGISIGRRVHA